MTEDVAFLECKRQPFIQRQLDPGEVQFHANVQRQTIQSWIELLFEVKFIEHKYETGCLFPGQKDIFPFVR